MKRTTPVETSVHPAHDSDLSFLLHRGQHGALSANLRDHHAHVLLGNPVHVVGVVDIALAFDRLHGRLDLLHELREIAEPGRC